MCADTRGRSAKRGVHSRWIVDVMRVDGRKTWWDTHPRRTNARSEGGTRSGAMLLWAEKERAQERERSR
eukprot:473271-Rhodomonas_salina.1